MSVPSCSVCLPVTSVYCGQTVGWIKMKLGMRYVGLSPSHIVLDGNPAPPPKKGAQPPIFGPYVRCGQMAGWIKMPLGMEVGIHSGHIVPHWDPAPLPKRGQSPKFSVYVCCQNGWMNQDATRYGGRPQPRRHCVR